MERGERVRRLRDAKGWKLKDLGAAIQSLGGAGSTANVSKVETGDRGPAPAATFDMYAEALDVPSETVLTGVDDAEIERDPIRLVRRHSLAKMISKHSVPADEAEVLRRIERAIGWGPLTLQDWERLRTYGLAYLKIRKPTAKVDARPTPASAKRRRANAR